MSVMCDTSRELERQDFTGADATSLVSPRSEQMGDGSSVLQVIEFPWETVDGPR